MSGLPAQRPTADFFGPELEDDEDNDDPDHNLVAAYWNRMREEVGKHGQTADFARIYFEMAGDTVDLVYGFDKSLATVTHHDSGAGYTEITIDPSVGIAIQFARADANSATATVTGCLFTRGSTVVRVYHSAECDFCLSVA